MDFVESLKNYLSDKGSAPFIGTPRWKSPSSFCVYVKMNEKDSIFYRLKVNKDKDSYKINKVEPIVRFDENYSPWDSTIKQTQTVFNSFPGIMGVANRTVNRSLI
jgi:hypothetical protein